MRRPGSHSALASSHRYRARIQPAESAGDERAVPTALARDELETAIQTNPDDLDLLERRCRLVFENFSPTDAEPAFRDLIARDPRNAAALHNHGSILYKLGRFDESTGAYRQSLELRPDRASTWLHLGYAFREAGKLDEAVAAWERCLTIEPGNPIATEELERAQQK